LDQKLKCTILLIYLCSWIPFQSSGQAERNNWYFGALAGVSFNGGGLSSLNDNGILRPIAFGQIQGPDNIAVVNDPAGNLLFYTEGRVFKNRLQQNMPSTPTDEYAFRESQQVVTRNPANPDQYYLFVIIQDGLMMRLSYTIVDMSLDNGLGDILLESAHTIVLNNVGQQLTTAQHANGRDIWVICQGDGTFNSFLVSPGGVSSVAIRSATGLSPVDGNFNNFGALQTSPNNELIAGVFPDLGKVLLFEFDNLTGQLNVIHEDEPVIAQPLPLTGVEFSLNSELLYVTHNTEGIRQYDLSDLSQIPDFITITPQTGGLAFSHLKRGPDGKIYISNRGTSFLGAVNEPNTLGLGCDYQRNVFNFSSGAHLLDLPTFLLPERPEGISFLNICLGETTELRFGTDFFSTNYEWDLGNGTTIMGSDTINYTYPVAGTYTVTVQGRDQFGSPTFSDSKEVSIYDSPNIAPIEDLYNCLEDTAIFFVFMEDEILDGLDPSVFQVSFYLNEEEALVRDNNVIEYTPEIGSQRIWVRMDNRLNFQCYDITSFDIITPEFFTIAIDTEQFICENSALTLRAPDGFVSYEWNTGSTDQEITINTTGDYRLTVVKDLGNFTCEASIGINVSQAPLPVIEMINITDWTSTSNSIEVIMEEAGRYEYSLDNLVFQHSNIFTELPIDDYQVFVRDIACEETVFSEELFLLYYDKFFTPNNDGFNDYWQIFNSKRETGLRISIYNRYGKLIAIIDPQGSGWDGTYNGINVPSSDYWFLVERPSGKSYNGHFTLKR